MLNKLLERFTPKQKLIFSAVLTAVLCIGISAGFYFGIVTSRKTQIQSLEDELAQQQKELQRRENLAKEVSANTKIKQKKERELAGLEKTLPIEEYVPTLLTQIEDLSLVTRAQINNITPGEISDVTPVATPTPGQPGQPQPVQPAGQPPQPQPSSNYKQMPLTIPFTGTFTSLRDFLEKAKSLSMVIVINSLLLNRNGEIDDYDGSPILSVSIPATIFILPKGEADASKQNIQPNKT